MAEDKLPCLRPASMAPTRSDTGCCRLAAMSLSAVQNAASRLTLVLCPAITMERLTTADLIPRLRCRSDARRDRARSYRFVSDPACARSSDDREPIGSTRLFARRGGAAPVCGLCAG